MKLHHTHRWDLDTIAARNIQNQLRTLVSTRDQLPKIKRVAGVDVGFERENTIAHAAVAVLNFPDLSLRESAHACKPVTMPYIPGYLSFREIPPILAALQALETLPDLILCDGQGLAHPRRFGIACHLGVLTQIPCIGVAKTRLTGTYQDPATEKGSWQPLLDHGEEIGAVLRTRSGCRPLYVSIGHRISLNTAIDYVLACCTRYRLPETTRWAHKLASGLGGNDNAHKNSNPPGAP